MTPAHFRFLLCVMAELWAALPRRLRLFFGEADGGMPCCDILANLFEDEPDLAQMLQASGFCSEPDVLAHVSQTLAALKSAAMQEASRLHKRRALVPVPTQGMLVRANKVRRLQTPDTAFTTAWLRQAGAIKRRGAWPTRRSQQLAAARDGVSRKAIEWRSCERPSCLCVLKQAWPAIQTRRSHRLWARPVHPLSESMCVNIESSGRTV